MDVIDFQYGDYTNRPHGRLPSIRNMSWKFCCDLLNKKSQLIKDIKFGDSRFSAILNCDKNLS